LDEIEATLASIESRLHSRASMHPKAESAMVDLDRADRQVTQQETVFRARADAQREAWLQAIDNLHKSVARFAADRRSDIETAVKHLQSEADAAKIKLDQLNKAEGASWSAAA
jgi:hypothetical protein